MRVQRGKAPAWAFGVMAVLAIAIGAYAWAMYGAPDGIRQQPFVTGKDGLPSMWYGVLWTHAVSAGLGLAIGWLQFVKRLRQRMPNVHRLIGYVYAAMIAIGGVTGLYLAFYANGGWVARIGFGALSVMWLYTLCLGVKSRRRPRSERAWPMDDTQLCAFLRGHYAAAIYSAGRGILRAFRHERHVPCDRVARLAA